MPDETVEPGTYVLGLKGKFPRDQQGFPFCESGSAPEGWEFLELAQIGGQGQSVQSDSKEVIAINIEAKERFNVVAGEVAQKDVTLECK